MPLAIRHMQPCGTPQRPPPTCRTVRCRTGMSMTRTHLALRPQAEPEDVHGARCTVHGACIGRSRDARRVALGSWEDA
eukprot:scaffold13786_cov31-Tisochrysis_lutea.AAC.1